MDVAGALAGLRINPDVTQDNTFEIKGNVDNTILVVTPNEQGASFASVAGTSKTYGGIYTLDNVMFRRGGHLLVGDFMEVLSNVSIFEYGMLAMDAPLDVGGTIYIGGHGVLTHAHATNTHEPKLDVTAARVEIAADGSIDVTGRGYRGGTQWSGPNSNYGLTLGNTLGATPGAGGSYGGAGGVYSGSSNSTYGDWTNPIYLGSGGGEWSGYGGNGGGRLFLDADDIVVDGAIHADGQGGMSTAAGCGSGGTLNLSVGTLNGTGILSADGGSSVNGTAGGGGRIAVRYNTSNMFSSQFTAGAGIGGWGTGATAGTVYLFDMTP